MPNGVERQPGLIHHRHQQEPTNTASVMRIWKPERFLA